MTRIFGRVVTAMLALSCLGCDSEPPPPVDDYRRDCENDADCVAVTPSKACAGECSGCGPIGAVNVADATRWAEDEAARRCSRVVAPVSEGCTCSVSAADPRCVNRECQMVARQ
jgi:hypothetical protein